MSPNWGYKPRYSQLLSILNLWVGFHDFFSPKVLDFLHSDLASSSRSSSRSGALGVVPEMPRCSMGLVYYTYIYPTKNCPSFVGKIDQPYWERIWDGETSPRAMPWLAGFGLVGCHQASKRPNSKRETVKVFKGQSGRFFGCSRAGIHEEAIGRSLENHLGKLLLRVWREPVCDIR